MEQQDSSDADYHAQIPRGTRTRRYAEEVSEWKISTMRHSMDVLPNPDLLSRTLHQNRVALPRISNHDYRSLFNSMNASCDDIDASTKEQYKKNEAVIVGGGSHAELLPSQLKKITLKLSYESPIGHTRKIIHNRPNPLNSSLEIVRKIQRKRKQLELIHRLRDSEDGKVSESIRQHEHSLYVRQSREVQKLLDRYPFEKKVVNELQELKVRRRSHNVEDKLRQKHPRLRKPIKG